METQAAPAPFNLGVEILTWIEKHKTRLLYGSAIVLVAIIGVLLFLQFQANKEISASQALSEIRVPFNPATPALPDTAQKLFDLANRHKGTKAAARALHLSGGLLFVEKDYARAQERFNALIQTYPESPWVPDANLGVAACLEAQGKTDDATKKYEDICKRYASATIVDDAKLARARLYEKSNPTESWRLYEELLNAERGSGMSAEAGLRQEELVKRNPELASLRQPPPAPPAPSTPSNMPVQITRITNRPSMTNRIMNITNLVRPATTNAGNSPTGGSPIQIQINPPPAAGTPPSATAPATTPPAPAPAPASPAAPAPAPAPPPAK